VTMMPNVPKPLAFPGRSRLSTVDQAAPHKPSAISAPCRDSPFKPQTMTSPLLFKKNGTQRDLPFGQREPDDAVEARNLPKSSWPCLLMVRAGPISGPSLNSVGVGNQGPSLCLARKTA
jgi:hypothetical protein